ncbi:MAG: 30S ribosomal protein S8, partial [Gammaproteobacteria bacterium]|nr:30S ribosomal protein S8 [Gammaproteobacteria bacterium]
MSMTDPIADMLTRIRNAQKAGKVDVSMPATRIKSSIAKVLQDEGYVGEFETGEVDGKPTLNIA